MEDKITRYFRCKKLKKYLGSKDESMYTHLDRIFKYYIYEDIEKLLYSYNFSKIELYPELNKRGNLFQFYFYYCNLVVSVQFDDMKIDYTVYLENMPPSYVEEYFVSLEYDDNFNIENFFESFYKIIQKDGRLNINKK